MKRWLWRVAAPLAVLCLGAGYMWRPPEAQVVVPGAREPAPAALAEAGEGCEPLAGLKPVDLVVRLPDGRSGWAGTAYWERISEQEPVRDRILVPIRRLITPLAPDPLGVTWDEATRTAALLREGSVLSIHFPEGRSRTALAVVNGEAVGTEALLCEGRTYASLGLVAESLALRWRWRDGRSILVELR
jgi:hypothetical protein